MYKYFKKSKQVEHKIFENKMGYEQDHKKYIVNGDFKNAFKLRTRIY